MIDQTRGRPDADDSLQRTERFLLLMAEGHTAEQAAKQARVGPWRALRIVTESDFGELLVALRNGLQTQAA